MVLHPGKGKARQGERARVAAPPLLLAYKEPSVSPKGSQAYVQHAGQVNQKSIPRRLCLPPTYLCVYLPTYLPTSLQYLPSAVARWVNDLRKQVF